MNREKVWHALCISISRPRFALPQRVATQPPGSEVAVPPQATPLSPKRPETDTERFRFVFPPKWNRGEFPHSPQGSSIPHFLFTQSHLPPSAAFPRAAVLFSSRRRTNPFRSIVLRPPELPAQSQRRGSGGIFHFRFLACSAHSKNWASSSLASAVGS
jgi:hypothetical protein